MSNEFVLPHGFQSSFSGAVTGSITASLGFNGTASNAVSSAWADNCGVANVSLVTNTANSSITSSYALIAQNIATGSVMTASVYGTASWANNSISASFAATSSVSTSDYIVTKTLTGSLGGWVGLVTSSITNQGSNIEIHLTVTDPAYSVAKTYIIPSQFPPGINWGWNTVGAIADTGAFNGLDFCLESSASNQQLFYRIKRNVSAFTANNTIACRIRNHGFTNLTLSDWAVTGSDSTLYGVANVPPLTSISSTGRVGIGTIFPQTTLHVSGTISASNVISPLQGTASWSSNSVTTSFALSSPATTLFTASLYPITSSWAIFAQTASFSVVTQVTQSNFTSSTTTSASWASQSVSASYSTFAQNSLATTLGTGSLYFITSSWSNNSVTASFITTASTASFIAGGNVIGKVGNATLSDTASFVAGGNVIGKVSTATTADTASFFVEKATFLNTGSVYPITSSWASNAITSSFALTSPATTLNTASTYPITSSQSVSSSWSPNQGATTLNTGSLYRITSSWATTATATSYDYIVSKVLTGSLGGWVGLVTSSITNQGSNLEIYLTSADVGFSLAKSYILPSQFPQPASQWGWNTVAPIADTGPYTGLDICLEASASNQMLFYRIKRNVGANTANNTIQCHIKNNGFSTLILSDWPLTGSDSNQYSVSQLSPLSNVANVGVGIGTIFPQATLHVIGNVSASQFIGTSSWASNTITSTNSTNTTNVNLSATNVGSTYFPVFSSTNSSGNTQLNVKSAGNFTYDAAGNQLGVTGITASLLGTSSWANNAVNAINATSATTAGTATTATNATNIAVTATSNNTAYNLLFATSPGPTTEGVLGDAGQNIQYNPSTDVFSVPYISATNITASMLGTSSYSTKAGLGNTLATTVMIGNQNYYPIVTRDNIAGTAGCEVDTASLFTFNPVKGQFVAPAISASNGFFGTSSYSISASWAPVDGVGTTLFTGSTYQITSSQSITSSFCSVAASVVVLNNTISAVPVAFYSSSTAGSNKLQMDANFSYDRSNGGLLTANKFAGALTGNVTGSTFGTSSWAINVVNQSTGSGTVLNTGSLYPITASWAVSASWAPTTAATGLPVAQRLNSNFSTTNATATNTNLSIAVGANTIWTCMANLISVTTAANIRYQVSVPTGATLTGWIIDEINGGGGFNQQIFGNTLSDALQSSIPNTSTDKLNFTVNVGSTSGNITIAAASFTNGLSVTVSSGSSLVAIPSVNV